MHATIAIFEDIAAASARMREAAHRADWDGLVAAESDCAVHIARARAHPAGPGELDPASRDAKARLIRRMLADDAEVRACVQPWMAKVEDLLAGNVARRRAHRAYEDAQDGGARPPGAPA